MKKICSLDGNSHDRRKKFRALKKIHGDKIKRIDNSNVDRKGKNTIVVSKEK